MRGALGAAFTTWLALVALQTLVSHGASGRVGQAFADVDKLVERALDPNVPAIPDRSVSANGTTTTSTGLTKAVGTPDRTKTKTTTPRLPVPGQQLAV